MTMPCRSAALPEKAHQHGRGAPAGAVRVDGGHQPHRTDDILSNIWLDNKQGGLNQGGLSDNMCSLHNR